jgi:membrane fusion protein (multidrug efflux system)
MTTVSKRPKRSVLAAIAGIVLAALIVSSLVGVKALQFRALGVASAQQVVPPERVNVTEVRSEEWRPRLSAVGSVNAVQGALISAQQAGVVREINFDAGSDVKAGAVLVRLDSDVEEAQLRSAEAGAALARTSLTRSRDLIKSRSISQADLDTAEANMKQADAQIANIRAAIDKKVVRAPFAGRLGIRRISVGQYLNQGDPVVSLQSLDPVYVDFSMPQQRLGEMHEGLQIDVTSDAYPGQPFEGLITAVDPNVDPATRNVRVQATLPNADARLRPGMFVSLDVVLARSEDVLVIPETAVMHAPYGDSVFVVEQSDQPGPDGQKGLVVRQQVVRLGARQGDFVVATEGAKAGDKVVSTGVFKLRPGMPVVIDNSLAPEFSYTPRPDNT